MAIVPIDMNGTGHVGLFIENFPWQRGMCVLPLSALTLEDIGHPPPGCFEFYAITFRSR